MPVSDRDFALLQEEVKCLRGKLSTTINQTGGYTEVITSPGSSVFPDDYFDDCECVDIQIQNPNPRIPRCSTDEDATGDDSLGDFGNDFQNDPFEGLFVFDAVNGVFYLPPGADDYEGRNTGLSDVSLRHGCKDVWWYKKKTPSQDNIILWRVGEAKVLRTESAGRTGWSVKTPAAPSGISLSDVVFKQIISDPFKENAFYLLAEANYKTYIVITEDDGANWTWTNLTAYNGVSQRKPIWMCINGNGGNLLWVSTWGDGKIRLLKLNNDSNITVSAEYDMGSATEWEVDNFYQTLSPISQVNTNHIWLYGRASNPQSLGLTHVLRIENDGLNFHAVQQDWGLDWAGSVKVSLSGDIYEVRNLRGVPTDDGGPSDNGDSDVATGADPLQVFYTGFAGNYFFDNYNASTTTKLYRSSISIGGNDLPVITGRTEIYDDTIFTPLSYSHYNDGLDALVPSIWGLAYITPAGSGSPVNSQVTGFGDFVAVDELIYEIAPSGFNPFYIRWVTVGDLGSTRRIEVDTSSQPVKVARMNSTHALAVYKNISGNLAAQIVFTNVDDDTLDSIDLVDSALAVDTSQRSFLVKMATDEFALIYYSGSEFKIVSITTTANAVSFGGAATILSTAGSPYGVVKLSGSELGVACLNGLDHNYISVGVSGSEGIALTFYTTPGTPIPEALDVGQIGSYIVCSYLDDAGTLKLASISP